MPKLADVGECPLCFGHLLPLSACQSCNTVAAREGLAEVGPEIACEDCGATNPTHFVCSACNARFPYDEIVKPEGPTCPVCRNPVPAGAELCPHCSAILPAAHGPDARSRRRVRGEYGEEDIHEVGRIPGVGRQRAETLCASGYNALWKIARASEGELARVKGVGPRAASQIKENLRFLLLVGRRKSKEEVLSEECACPLCGTVTSLFASRCHECGAQFDEEELDEEFRKEVEREEDKGLLAYYDVRLLEEPESAPLHYGRAVLLLAMGRPADALASLDKVLELDPKNAGALQAKVRALSAAKGVGAAAQVLRGVVAARGPEARRQPGSPEERSADEEQALRALSGLEEVECPECGEKQTPGATVCPVCGHRFAPEGAAAAAPEALAEDRLLEELERAVAGEAKAPPPPLKPEVPAEVVEKKRAMLAFLLKIPGVSRRAAEAVSGFFQDLDQVNMSEATDLAEIPGVAPAESRLIKDTVERYLAPAEVPEERPVARATPEPEVSRSRPVAKPPIPPPVPAPRPAPSPGLPTRAPLVVVEGRRGLINGRGLVNGRGRVNGLINGTGFVNGSAVAELRLPRRRLMPRYVAIGLGMMMLFGTVALLIPEGQTDAPAIRIDGDFGDWSGVSLFSNGTDPGDPNVQIRGASLLPRGSTLFLRVAVEGSIFADASDYDTVYAFLDTDGSGATGYDLGDLGADYAVSISGSAGTVGDARLLRYDSAGRTRDDWAGFVTATFVTAAAGGDGVEVAVPVVSMDPYDEQSLLVRFAVDDNEGRTSHTPVPIGVVPGALRVTLTPQRSVLSGGSEAFLTVTFESLEGVEFRITRILLDESGGAVPADLAVDMTVPADGSQVYTIDADATGLAQGTLVTASVTGVVATPSRPIAILGPEARAYVGQGPTGKQVDGWFGEWLAPENDGDPTSVRRPSLNIANREGNVSGNRLFLHAKFVGEVLEGGMIPERRAKPPPSGPGNGTQAPPGGPRPSLVGFDYLRFYVDTNVSEPGGYDAGGLVADWLLEVWGRGGRVIGANASRWNGSGFARDSPLNAAANGQEIEVGATLAGTSAADTRFLLISADWSGVADRADPASTRGTRGGESPPVVFDISGNGPFWFRDTNHASETACTYNKVAKSQKGPGPLKQITLSTGETACWYVDETTSQTIPAGDWETLIDISGSGAGINYDVRIEIWNKATDSVSESIQTCLDVTTFGDDVQCTVAGVGSKVLSSDQVVRLVVAHSFTSGTVTIDYDDSDSSGDSRATLPLPEFSDIVLPLSLILVAALGVVRRRRRAA